MGRSLEYPRETVYSEAHRMVFKKNEDGITLELEMENEREMPQQ